MAEENAKGAFIEKLLFALLPLLIGCTGYLISATINSNYTLALSAGSTALFNVHTISYAGTGGYALGCNASTTTLNVTTITSIYGQALCTNYLNGYCGTIVGALNLYGGQVGGNNNRSIYWW